MYDPEWHNDEICVKKIQNGHLCLLVGGHPHPDILLLPGRVPQGEADHLDKSYFGFTETIACSFAKCLFQRPLEKFFTYITRPQ